MALAAPAAAPAAARRGAFTRGGGALRAAPRRAHPTRHRAAGGAARAAADVTVLAADIGGTNARYQLWRIAAGAPPALTFEKTFQTAAHASFEASLAAALKEAGGAPPAAACFAVAGPVANERCTFTNLKWTIDGAALKEQLRTAAVRVINDFEAVGYGILDLPPASLLTLNAAPPVARAPMVVLGPGTGLGQAVLTWDDVAGGYRVWPSEGSHADFAPRGEMQRALAAHAEAALGECEVEHLCCGSGLVRIYDFLRHHRGGGDAGLAPADVTDRALRGACPLCVEAVDMLLEILGAESANLGLKLLARGGVFIAGGIPGKLLPRIRSCDTLQRGFLRPGCRFAPVRASMPLHVVLSKDPGLDGARTVALRALAAMQ